MSDALLVASTAGDVETVASLLQQGVSVLSKQRNGHTRLHKSAQEGHDAIVKLFLDHEADVNIRGWSNRTPLIQASARGHLSIVRLLISRGADLELSDATGTTALIYASRRDYPDIVSELLSRGAQEDVKM